MILEVVGYIGVLFGGYFILRIIEAVIIGSWNYPKGDYRVWYDKNYGGVNGN